MPDKKSFLEKQLFYQSLPTKRITVIIKLSNNIILK